MEEKRVSLFREKSLQQIESPEAMNDYLRVTSPGVWLVLAAIVAFLAGVILWGFLGHIDSTTSVAVIADGDKSVCLVPQEALESAVEDRKVTIYGKEYDLMPETLNPEVITDETNVYWVLAGDYDIGELVYRIPLTEKVDAQADDGLAGTGVIAATIVTERLSPASLLLN